MARVRDMTSGIIAGVSGVFLVNAVPHSVMGKTGRRFPTPFYLAHYFGDLDLDGQRAGR